MTMNIHLSKKGVDYIRNEFDKTDQAVMNAAGVSPALVRLPGGELFCRCKDGSI